MSLSPDQDASDLSGKMSNTASTHAEVHAYLAMVHPTKGTVTSPINPMKDLTLSARQRIYREGLQPSQQALILPPRPDTHTVIDTEADSDVEVIRNTADIPVYPAGGGRPTYAEGPYTSYQSQGRTNRWPRTNGRLNEEEIDARDNELQGSVLGYVERIGGEDMVDWGLLAHFLSTTHHKSFAEVARYFGYRPEDEHNSALAAKMLYEFYSMKRLPAGRRLGQTSGMGVPDTAAPDSRALVVSRYPPSSPDSFVSAT